MVTICQKCGDRGFSLALIYCGKCLANALHRYCLDVWPVTVDEYVTWFCDNCESKSALNAMAVIRDHQISEFHPEFDNGSFRLRLDEAEARVSDPERLLDDHERSLVESKGEISTKNVRIAGLEHEVSDVLQASIKSDQELNAIRSEVSFLRKDNESIVKDIETARAETEKLKVDLFAAEDKIKETKRLHLAAMDDKQRRALNLRRKMIGCKSALDTLSRKFKSQLKYKLLSKNHLIISFSHFNARRLYIFHRSKKYKRQTLKVKKRKCFEDKLNHMV